MTDNTAALLADILAVRVALNTRIRAEPEDVYALQVGLDRVEAAIRAKHLPDPVGDGPVIGEPDTNGGFVGDTWFGHPEKRTLATHQWDGEKWKPLCDEVDVVLVLLAEERRKSAERRAAYGALTQTLIDSERREKEAATRIAQLEARLEVAPGWSQDADGIACRDDTIKLQDERIKQLEARCEKLAGVAETLRKEAVLHLNNSEGCAHSHYGHDPETEGWPGWLVDSRARIEAATAALEKDQDSGN